MKKLRLSSKGVALPTVIMVMLVVMTIVGISLTLIVSQTRTGVIYEDNMKAIHSVDTGINDYLWNLNKENAAPLPMNTEIDYPAYHPQYAYTLKEIEVKNDKRVVQVTGWELSDPEVKRTVEVTFSKRSFTQFVYFSNNDPSNIWWMTGEKCYGPYHTNTSLRISGNPIFYDKVSYVNKIEYQSGVTSHPQFQKGTQKVAAISYPSNNSELMNYAQVNGYLYQGRTSIRLNSNGTITVWNPKSDPATHTIPLPPNGVIYVNGTNSSDRNDVNAGNVYISGVLKGRLTVAAKNNIYITDFDPTYQYFSDAKLHVTNGISYANTDFNVDLSTGKITVTGTGNDMLGLIADNNVALLTYGWFDNNTALSAVGDMKVCGAFFAINGSFVNPNNETRPYPSGTLTVRGAIIQKERGAVGYTVTDYSGTKKYGYSKDYAHDPRMKYDAPPFFIQPVDSGWEILDWDEK